MFRQASETFGLSEETRAALHDMPVDLAKHDGDTDTHGNATPHHKLDKAAVLRHAAECRRQIQLKWAKFQPSQPQLVTKKFYDVEHDCWQEEQVLVEIDAEPFGHGAIRECFRMKEIRPETRAISGDDVVRDASDTNISTSSGYLDQSSDGGTPSSGISPTRHIGLGALVMSIVGLKHNERRTLWVAKRAMKGHDDIDGHRNDCKVDVIYQSVAKKYAHLFSTEVRKRAQATGLGRMGARDMDFLLTHFIELSDGRTYGVEAFLFGDYQKHNNNSGATIGCRRTPQSFSYYSFIRSNRKLMIVDIQGIDDIYTDPVIHFLPSYDNTSFGKADSNVNLGIRGFALFLWSHRHNDIDRLLGMPVFSLSRSEQSSLRMPGEVSIGALNQSVAGVAEAIVNLSSVHGVNVSPAAWRSSDIPVVKSAHGNAVVPEELIEAACHMEIAIMYHDGRLNSGALASKDDIESAVFHVVEAAKAGLPEALMAFARLASDLEHEDFLPQVVSSEEHKGLCLAVLECAAAAGVVDAHGALARLMLDGGYCALGIDETRRAAYHLEAFAEGKAAAATDDDGGEEAGEGPRKAQEASSRCGCNFGWESHGWESHNAYARAAELYEKDFRKDEGALAKAKELWEAAAECALEQPRLAKQAMRYTERAEQLDQEPNEEQCAADSQASTEADTEGVDLHLRGQLARKFAAFSASFATPEAALEELLRVQAEGSELSKPKGEASSSAKRDYVVDEDVWAMLGN